MPRKPAGKGKGRGKTSNGNKENGEDGSPLTVSTSSLADDMASEVEKDVADLEAPTMIADSLASDIGNDELVTFYKSKSKKARVLSNLTENEQEDVALFLERNDFIYNKRRTDHISVSKKNKAWKDLAKEMGKEVKALVTFFESIRTQMGKLRRKKSGQAAVEMTDRQQWIWTRFQFLMPHIGQVTQRTVQSFRSGPITNQGEETREEEPQSTVTTTLSSTTSRNSTVTTSSTRGSRVIGALQTPTMPEVPHPERLKFAEYLGLTFQNLPKSIYREVQKAMFNLLCDAEKQADLEVGRSAPEPLPTQQNRQWQPDPSQWQLRLVNPAQSVLHSQDPVWVKRQYKGYTQSPSQQELVSNRSSETATYKTTLPAAESQNPRRSYSAPVPQEEQSFSLSEIMMETAVAAPVIETPQQ